MSGVDGTELLGLDAEEEIKYQYSFHDENSLKLDQALKKRDLGDLYL